MVPLPACTTLPLPPMVLPTTSVLLLSRSKRSVALFVMVLALAIAPVAPPLPMASVPALMSVAPV